MIDRKEALRLLRAAVGLRGADYVDPRHNSLTGCEYVVGDAPACIVGTALAIHGIPLHAMRGCEGDAQQLSGHLGVDVVGPGAVDTFMTAQKYQDEGETWGYAYEAAAAKLR